MAKQKDWFKTQPGYREIGRWGWNEETLWSKIEVSLNTNDCWTWLGAMSPTGALFGAYKNNRQQMTQARRLVWMSHTNEDVKLHRVTLTCGNQQCVNPHHFELKKNNRPDKIW